MTGIETGPRLSHPQTCVIGVDPEREQREECNSGGGITACWSNPANAGFNVRCGLIDRVCCVNRWEKESRLELELQSVVEFLIADLLLIF